MRDRKTPCRALLLATAALVFACERLDSAAELASATARFDARDYATAAIHARNVLQAEPGNVAAMVVLGRIAAELGDVGGAIEVFGRAKDLGADPSLVVEPLADALLERGEAGEALAVLDGASAALQDRSSYWVLRSEALASERRIVEAEQSLNRSVSMAGAESVRTLLVRAQLAAFAADPVTAQQSLDRAVQLRPGDRRALVARGLHYLRTAMLEAAVRDLQEALDQYSKSPMSAAEGVLSATLVQAYLALNRSDAAAATAQRFAARAPGAALSEYTEGLVAYAQGRFEEAAPLVQSAVNRVPGNPRFLTLLGGVHLALGNLGQAEQQLLTALSNAPDDPATVKLLAETRLRQQRPDGALDLLVTLEGEERQDPSTNLLRGLANLQAGNAEEAVAYLEQVVAADPGNQSVKLDLARAYLVLNRNADAASLLDATFGQGSPQLAALRSGSVAADRETAERLQREFPNDASSLVAAAALEQLGGNVQEALRLLERAVAVDATYVLARLHLAELLVQQGRSQESEQQLRRAIVVEPDNVRAVTALARLAESRGAVDEAIQLLTGVLARSPDAGARLVLAQLYIRQSRLEDAAREIDQAEALVPDSANVRASRGFLALAERRFGDAVEVLAEARMRLPARLDVVQAYALALIATDQAAEARQELRAAVRRVPTSLPLRTVLGVAELRAGSPDAALEIAKALQTEFPAASNGYLLEAETRLAQRRYDTAAESLAVAFRNQPSWEVLRHQIGALRLANRKADVERVLQSWVAEHADHVPGRLEYAALLREDGRADEAAEQYDYVLALNGDNVVALNDAAWLYQQIGRAGALELAERARRLAPEEPAVLDTLGWILVQQNRDADGIRYLGKAAELAPENPDIRYHVAAAQARLGRMDDARATLRSLLANAAPFAERAAAEALLAAL